MNGMNGISHHPSNCATPNDGSPSDVDILDGAPKMKYVVVTGGLMSGLGKGVTISALGAMLHSLDLKVTAIKIDPYLNIDAGTMSPFEHGEVYVLDDGGEVDLDLGNYERSLGATFTSEHNITTGKIFKYVLDQERRGTYLGSTVQLVPHVTDAIKGWIHRVSRHPIDASSSPPDVCLIEVGGTVGDIESAVYLEALQQLAGEVGGEHFCLCHLSYVPSIGKSNEQKTKPTQHSSKELCRSGMKPDFIFCRSKFEITQATKNKISTFTQVKVDHVISLHEVGDLNDVPAIMYQQGLAVKICQKLRLPHKSLSSISAPHLPWNILSRYRLTCNRTTTVGIVGKYVGLPDTYLSVMKALDHAALESRTNVSIRWIDSEELERPSNGSVSGTADELSASPWKQLMEVDAVVCPGGFGDRGVRGKVLCAEYCREKGVPFLGICLGMQVAAIEFALNVLKLEGATSEEFEENSKHHVVVSMPEHTNCYKGGTMRLGKRKTVIKENSLAFKLYDQTHEIEKRHRHRYEINPKYIELFEKRGLKFVGQDCTGDRMEIMELEGHPYFIGVQYHPEFCSRPFKPSPVFLGLMLAAVGELNERLIQNNGKLLPGKLYENI